MAVLWSAARRRSGSSDPFKDLAVVTYDDLIAIAGKPQEVSRALQERLLLAASGALSVGRRREAIAVIKEAFWEIMPTPRLALRGLRLALRAVITPHREEPASGR